MKYPLARHTDALAATAAVIAILALAGKTLEIPFLQGWCAHTVAMKDKTAFLIIGHAAAGYVIAHARSRRDCIPAAFIAVPTILIGIGLAREISTWENLASFDPLKSWYPSIVTVAATCLLSAKALLALAFNNPWPARVASFLATATGCCALCGYIIGQPAMYYFVPGYTTAMAINTAACFLIEGLLYVPRKGLPVFTP